MIEKDNQNRSVEKPYEIFNVQHTAKESCTTPIQPNR
ncbi:hypothetical protein SAMN05428978_10295 [Nitrosomonas sp. Nm34]|nr:hypothetical protein SAMN05428978_10295 [Nitrosomonas sp. Nm34]